MNTDNSNRGKKINLVDSLQIKRDCGFSHSQQQMNVIFLPPPLPLLSPKLYNNIQLLVYVHMDTVSIK